MAKAAKLSDWIKAEGPLPPCYPISGYMQAGSLTCFSLENMLPDAVWRGLETVWLYRSLRKTMNGSWLRKQPAVFGFGPVESLLS